MRKSLQSLSSNLGRNLSDPSFLAAGVSFALLAGAAALKPGPLPAAGLAYLGVAGAALAGILICVPPR